MGLQEQHVAFKFAGGIETKMDSKAVPSVRLLALENGVFTKAISIKKRNGYRRLSNAIDGSTSEVSGGRRLGARDNELLMFTAAECYSRQTSVEQWINTGALVAPTGHDRAAVHTGTEQATPCHATNAGITVYAWEDSRGGVWWTTVDATTDKVLRAPTQANAAGARPRCVPAGDAVLVLYAVPATSEIRCVVVNAATPTAAPPEVPVIGDLDATNGYYDAVPTTRVGSPALIAWRQHATTNVRVAYVTASGDIGSPGNGHPSGATPSTILENTSPIACAYSYVDGADGDIVATAYVCLDGTGRVSRMSGGTVSIPIGTTVNVEDTLIGGTAALRNTLTIADTGTEKVLWAVFEENAAASSNHYCQVNSVGLTSGLGVARNIRSLCLASRAFNAGRAGDTFAVFVHDTTYFNVYLTLRLSDFAPAGRHLPGSACGPKARHVPAVYVSDNLVTLALTYKTRLQSADSDKFTESAIRAVVMDFDDPNSHQVAQLGRGLYLAGACPQHYAGRLWTEQGFHVGPETITTAKAATGSLTLLSTYEYLVWYEWTDDLGEIHRGPTSVPVTVTLAGAENEVTLTLPTLRVTRKSNVRICVARCEPGDTSKLYRVSSLDPTTAGSPNGYVANDTSVDSVSFTDRMSDATLLLQEQHYTTGGILSNDPAPLGSCVVASKNRLFFTDAQAGSVVRFSKRIATGFGAECAPEFQHDVNQKGGDITALAEMDDVIYVFKRSMIYAFNGDGPFEDGTNASGSVLGGFSGPQIITEEVGCIAPSSIASTSEGLTFDTGKGIYLITRGRELRYIGAPAELYNTQDVCRATALPKRNAVLFLTPSGKSLYYDHQFQQWSTFTNHEGLDAVVVGESYHYLRTDGSVYEETPGVYADDGARITLRFETAWLHLLEHLQGFQRFWKLLLLGTWVSPHQLAISHRLDYDEAWTDPYYLDATGEAEGATGWITGDSANPIGEDPLTGTVYGENDFGHGPYGGEGPDVYWWRYGIHASGSSIQFRFEDYEKADQYGASFELTEMTIVGGVKKVDKRPFSGARST